MCPLGNPYTSLGKNIFKPMVEGRADLNNSFNTPAKGLEKRVRKTKTPDLVKPLYTKNKVITAATNIGIQ